MDPRYLNFENDGCLLKYLIWIKRDAIFLEEAWDNCAQEGSIMLMHELNHGVIKSIFKNWTSSFLFSPTPPPPLFLSVLRVVRVKKEKKKKIKTEEENLEHDSDSVIFVL